MIKYAVIALAAIVALSGCADDDAFVASKNISKDADNFQVMRRVVFYNAIQDKYILEMTGFCSITADATDQQLEVICNEGKGLYRKHYLGYSDNVTYTVEQIESKNVSPYHYKIVFKPESILPMQNIEVR